MAALVLFAASGWLSPTQEAEIAGSVSVYARKVMEEVAVKRRIISDTTLYNDWLDTHAYDGMVALQRCGDLYRTVWINGDRLYVADCCQKKHYPCSHVAEVGHQTRQRWLARGPWPDMVTVRFKPPPSPRLVAVAQ